MKPPRKRPWVKAQYREDHHPYAMGFAAGYDPASVLPSLRRRQRDSPAHQQWLNGFHAGRVLFKALPTHYLNIPQTCAICGCKTKDQLCKECYASFIEPNLNE